ncbi:hypothetical protein [Streptomyces sp. SID3343]|uniref:hypothetical protein n=1 Tax=Streptomyces sp. SID3343 TaxID=2690260 RepID=UPI00136B3E0A|nr:hypothetical protein [Streptomyces sp. SID3343]MYW05632.1 hypothetical protein [Streptomyces sp. SID3343]
MNPRRVLIAVALTLATLTGMSFTASADTPTSNQRTPGKVSLAASFHHSSEFKNVNLVGAPYDVWYSGPACNTGAPVGGIQVTNSYRLNIESHRTWSYCQSNHFFGILEGSNSGWWGGIQNDLGGFKNSTVSIGYR